MKITNNTAVLKDLTRGAVMIGGALTVALNTWLAKGHTFGLNKETVLGVIGTAALPIINVLARYIDKADPAYGLVSDNAAKALAAKVSDITGASAS